MNKQENTIEHHRIKASTLTEVIVALTIITLISALFFAIIIKAGNYHKNRRNIIIHQQVLGIIDETEKYALFENEQFNYDGYFITKEIKPFKDIDNVYQIEVSAYKQDETIIMNHKAIVQKYIANWDY